MGKKTAGSVALQFIWGIRLSLWAEAAKLWAEGAKLWAEGDKAKGDKLRADAAKLWSEGDKLWAEGVIEACGNVTMEWTVNGDGFDCKLGTGEKFVHK